MELNLIKKIYKYFKEVRMKKRVFRERYGETKVEFVKEENNENVADVKIEAPKKKKTTTKKGNK